MCSPGESAGYSSYPHPLAVQGDATMCFLLTNFILSFPATSITTAFPSIPPSELKCPPTLCRRSGRYSDEAIIAKSPLRRFRRTISASRPLATAVPELNNWSPPIDRPRIFTVTAFVRQGGRIRIRDQPSLREPDSETKFYLAPRRRGKIVQLPPPSTANSQ